MRGTLLLLSLVLLAPTGASLSVGPLSLDLEFNDLGSCSVGTGDVCVASWDAGSDPGLGDDRVDATRVVQRASVSVEVPGASPVELDARPEDVELRHPTFFILEDAWIAANGTLPGPAREFVTLEARAMNTRGPDPPGGVLIVVHSPAPLVNPLSGEE